MNYRNIKRLISFLLITLLVLASGVSGVYGQESFQQIDNTSHVSEEYVAHQLVIKYKTTNEGLISSLQKLTEESTAGKVVKQLPEGARLLELPKDKDIRETMLALSEDPNIEYVEPNYYVYAFGPNVHDESIMLLDDKKAEGDFEVPVPNDPFYSEQYGPQLIKAPYAWSTVGFNSAVVAVIDTGVQTTHPDLQGRVLPNGWNFVQRKSSGLPYNPEDISDDNGHGTHVFGIISAIYNNGIGIVGCSGPADVKILPVKVLNDKGQGTSFDVSEGIKYAADQGVDVINLSLGTSFSSNVLSEAVSYAQSKGCVVVAAAGNESRRVELTYPASYLGVIAVGAVDNLKRRAYFSNYGDRLDLTAPGVAVLSTVPDFVGRPNQKIGEAYGDDESGYYEKWSGTSMAAPYVAAAAALYKCIYPDASVLQVCEVLTSTAEDIGDLGRDPETGYGLVDLAAIMGQEPIKRALAFRGPKEGQSVFGTVIFKVQIGMPAQVSTLEFYIDEIAADCKIKEITCEGEETVSFEWDSKEWPDGEHKIIALAKDSSGEQIGKTEELSISINNVITSGLRLEVTDPDGKPAASATAYVIRKVGNDYSTKYYYADENGFIRVPGTSSQDVDGYDVTIFGEIDDKDKGERFLYNHKFEEPGWYQIGGENTVKITLEMHDQESAKLTNPLYCLSPLDFNYKRKTVIGPWRETQCKLLHIDPGTYEAYGFWSPSLPEVRQAAAVSEDSPTYLLRAKFTIEEGQNDTILTLNVDNGGKIVAGTHEEQDHTILYLKVPEESEHFGIPLLSSGLKGQEIILPPGEYEVSADVVSIQDGDEWSFYLSREKTLSVAEGINNPTRIDFGKRIKIAEFQSKTGTQIEKGKRLETINKFTDKFGNNLAYAYGPRRSWSLDSLFFVRKETDDGLFRLFEWSPEDVGGFKEVEIDWLYRNDPIFSVYDSNENQIYENTSSFNLNGSIWDSGRDYTTPLPPGPGHYQARLSLYAGPLSGTDNQLVQETLDFEIIVPEGKETVDIVVKGPQDEPVSTGEIKLFKWEENDGWQLINKNKRLITKDTGLVQIPTNFDFSSQNINLALIEARMYSLTGFSSQPFSTIYALDKLNLSDVKPIEVSISDDFGNDLTNNLNANRLKLPLYSDGGGRLPELKYVTEVSVIPRQASWGEPWRIYLDPGIHNYCYTTFRQGNSYYLLSSLNIEVNEGAKLDLNGQKTARCEIVKADNVHPRIMLRPAGMSDAVVYSNEIVTKGSNIKYMILSEGKYSPLYKLENTLDTNTILVQTFEMGEKELEAGQTYEWGFGSSLETAFELDQNEFSLGDKLTGSVSFHDEFGNRLKHVNIMKDGAEVAEVNPCLVLERILPNGEIMECMRKESSDFWECIEISLPDDLQPGNYQAFLELPLTETIKTNHVEFTVKGELEEHSKYELTVDESNDYELEETESGLKLIVRQAVAGFKEFGATVRSRTGEGLGQLNVVFTHLRNNIQRGLNTISADFDASWFSVKAGFNVEPGDFIKIFMVDELTNDLDRNPIILK